MMPTVQRKLEPGEGCQYVGRVALAGRKPSSSSAAQQGGRESAEFASRRDSRRADTHQSVEPRWIA